MLGDAALAQEMAALMLERGVYVDRLLLPGGAEGPGAHPHADVGGALDAPTSTARSRPSPTVGRELGVVSMNVQHDAGAGQGEGRAGHLDGGRCRCPRSARTTC